LRSAGASFLVVVLILGCIVGLNIRTVAADSKTIYVDVKNNSGVENGTFQYPFDSIQEGIDNATAGDTVFVWNGTYYLNVSINLNKSLQLEGEDKDLTIIDGNQTDYQNPASWIAGINVTASNVTIKKFTIRKASPGINLTSSNFSTIRDNIIITDLYHVQGDDPTTSYGVNLEHSSNNVVCNNNLTNNGYGIVLKYSSNYNNITDNLVVSKAEKTDPARYWDGITIYSSNHNRVINNTIGKLWDVGIGFYNACNNTVQGNAITDIYGRNEPYDEVQQLGYGISLYYESHYNVVTNNNVANAYWGIELWTNCDGNSIQYNTVINSSESNSSGLKLWTNCSGNNVMFNSLVNSSLGF
jgi:parallel beta-helix repeat protein